MNELLLQYIDKALKMEQKGYPEEAIQLLDKILTTFQESREIILLEKAKLEFRNGYDKKALLDFIIVYELLQNSDIYDLILEAYYIPNKDTLFQMYQNNIQFLREYPHYKNEYENEELEFIPIWQDNESLIYVNMKERRFDILKRRKLDDVLQEDIVAMLINELWKEDILKCEKSFRIEEAFMDMNNPLYLAFDRTYWELFIQLYDIEQFFTFKRIVFLVGKNSAYDYLSEDTILLPSKIVLNIGSEGYIELLEQIKLSNNKKCKEYKEEIEKYYKENAINIIERVKKRKIRIVFSTCRFTTALQYHTRDCMMAAENLGYETKYLIEQDGIHRMTLRYKLRILAEFKPDVWFQLDHFRPEWEWFPKEIIYLTWVQDKLPQTTGNKERVASLLNRDIILSMFISDLSGKQWDMEYKDALKMPISANKMIYKNWKLSEQEKEYYSCDICLLGHVTNYKEEIEDFMTNIPKEFRQDIQDIIKVYIDLMEQEEFFYGYEQTYKIIYYIANSLHIYFNESSLFNLSKYLYDTIYYIRYKLLIAEWLIDNGYTNLKIYGKGWDKMEKFQAYAMGTIENGEKLSKALGAAKISVGFHPHVSLPAKVIEAISSGTLCITHNIPQEFDLANAREYFKEDKEIVYYYGKEDLLKKVEYYLEHEEERKNIIKAGQKRIEEELTYEKILSKVLQEAAELVEKREGLHSV